MYPAKIEKRQIITSAPSLLVGGSNLPDRQETSRMVMGDSSGNFGLFLLELSMHGTIGLTVQVEELQRFLSIADDLSKPLNKEEFDFIKRFLNKVKYNPRRSILSLGDNVAERGKDDTAMLYLFYTLEKNNVEFSITLSNHDYEFIMCYCCGRSPSILESQRQSLTHFQASIDAKVIAEEEARELAATYIRHVRLFDYQLRGKEGNEQLIIYSHAPINLSTIAKTLGILLTLSDEEETEDVSRFDKLLKKADNYGFDSLGKDDFLVLIKIIDHINQEVCKLLISGELFKNKYDELSSHIRSVIWNREIPHEESSSQKILFMCGHIGTSETERLNALKNSSHRSLDYAKKTLSTTEKLYFFDDGSQEGYFYPFQASVCVNKVANRKELVLFAIDESILKYSADTPYSSTFSFVENIFSLADYVYVAADQADQTIWEELNAYVAILSSNKENEIRRKKILLGQPNHISLAVEKIKGHIFPELHFHIICLGENSKNSIPQNFDSSNQSGVTAKIHVINAENKKSELHKLLKEYRYTHIPQYAEWSVDEDSFHRFIINELPKDRMRVTDNEATHSFFVELNKKMKVMNEEIQEVPLPPVVQEEPCELDDTDQLSVQENDLEVVKAIKNLLRARSVKLQCKEAEFHEERSYQIKNKTTKRETQVTTITGSQYALVITNPAVNNIEEIYHSLFQVFEVSCEQHERVGDEILFVVPKGIASQIKPLIMEGLRDTERLARQVETSARTPTAVFPRGVRTTLFASQARVLGVKRDHSF